MKRKDTEDAYPLDYEAEAQSLERELVAVVARVLASPEMRASLEQAIEPALREVLEQQKNALRHEADALRLSLGTGNKRGGRARSEEPQPWQGDYVGEKSGITLGQYSEDRPSERAPAIHSDDPPSQIDPQNRSDGKRRYAPPSRVNLDGWKLWTALGGCLLVGLLLAGFVTRWALFKKGGENPPPNAESENGSQTEGKREDGLGTETTAPEAAVTENDSPLRAVWLEEVGKLRAALPSESPLLASTPAAQFDCFFPAATRNTLDRLASSRLWRDDIAREFEPCVDERFRLTAGQKNAAVFAAQGLTKRLLSASSEGALWCASPPAEVRASGITVDGETGPKTWKALDALLVCSDIREATPFSKSSRAEDYAVAVWVALREIDRLAPSDGR